MGAAGQRGRTGSYIHLLTLPRCCFIQTDAAVQREELWLRHPMSERGVSPAHKGRPVNAAGQGRP